MSQPFFMFRYSQDTHLGLDFVECPLVETKASLKFDITTMPIGLEAQYDSPAQTNQIIARR